MSPATLSKENARQRHGPVICGHNGEPGRTSLGISASSQSRHRETRQLLCCVPSLSSFIGCSPHPICWCVAQRSKLARFLRYRISQKAPASRRANEWPRMQQSRVGPQVRVKEIRKGLGSERRNSALELHVLGLNSGSPPCCEPHHGKRCHNSYCQATPSLQLCKATVRSISLSGECPTIQGLNVNKRLNECDAGNQGGQC